MVTLSERIESFFDKITGNNVYVFACLGFLCIVVYANSLDVPFYFDDYAYIAQNPFIRSLGWIFDKDLIAQTPLYEDIKDSVISRPLSYFTFAVNFILHNRSVTGYHLVNISIHLINSCLAYELIMLTYSMYAKKVPITERLSDIKAAVQKIAFFTAAIFAVHPVMTNAVTYIIQRAASLATLFYLLTLVLYARCGLSGGKSARVIWYLLSIASCVAAVKSKEIAFTLPFMVMVYDAIFCSGSIRNRFQKLAPFLLCIVVVILLSDGGIGTGNYSPQINTQPSILQVVSFAKALPMKYLTTQFVTNPNATSVVSMSPLEYLFTQFRVVVTYQRLLLVPVGLNFVHDYPFYRTLTEPVVLLSLGLHLLILLSAVYLYRHSNTSSGEDVFMLRLAVFGIVWFYLSLAMECGIIPMDDLFLEHRMYLPAFGFLVALVSLLQFAARRLLLSSFPVSLLFAAVIMVFSTFTVLRNEQWRDPLTFWQDALAKSPGKMRIHAYLGNIYRDRGDIRKSLQEYKLAFSGNYPYAEDHLALGDMFLENKMYKDAIDEYQAALKGSPENFEVHSRLEEAYRLLKCGVEASP